MNEDVEKTASRPLFEVGKDNRYRIDRLLGKKDIKYRGFLSSRSMKTIGFVLLFFAQVYLCISLVGKFIDLSESTLNVANVLDTLSMFSLPMFLIANFCVIINSKTKIKKMLIVYSVIAIGVYLLIIFGFYRYLIGIAHSISPDDPSSAYLLADLVAKKLFGKVINYNVFVDLTLFSLFYFFLFYTPKRLEGKNRLAIFRLLSIIPALLTIGASVLYGLYNIEIIDLPVAILAILPCRSLAIYAIFFGIAFFIKLRQHLFFKWGGTQEEFEKYCSSNRSSLEVSIAMAVITLFVCIIDFLLLIINPWLLFYGIGLNFYFALCTPLIMLLSYTRKPRSNVWDMVTLAMFFFAVIILYLETGYYIIINL